MAAAPDASSASACCISAQNCCSADGCAGLALSKSTQTSPRLLSQPSSSAIRATNGCGSTPGRLPRAPPVQVALKGGRQEPEGRRRPAANATWLVLSANAMCAAISLKHSPASGSNSPHQLGACAWRLWSNTQPPRGQTSRRVREPDACELKPGLVRGVFPRLCRLPYL